MMNIMGAGCADRGDSGMRSIAVARAASLIIDHSGSGKPLGWLPALHRKLCHFGANPDQTELFKAAPPAMKCFHVAKTRKRPPPVRAIECVDYHCVIK
ncbi:hypothetical protein [Bradyrhizobium sp. CCBAU 11434]|uniref:hypothetical protein n=1 Tax=Bradyrhizobium sp. CCBAU 11434 TaxID=1630885 RepID=UPI00230604AB|nr:hypothetical protein [Bradyrhizobium sp. CCBAU 11434]